MIITRRSIITALVTVLVLAAPARADKSTPPSDSRPPAGLYEPASSFPTDFELPTHPPQSPYSYEWYDERMTTTIGVGVSLGGGVSGFTDSAMRAIVSESVSGVWNLRVAVGTHIPLGIEVGYLGSAANLQTLGNDYNGMLIGTTIEAAVRYTILPHADGTPYLFIGAGWQRFTVRDVKFAESDTGLRDSDTSAEFPMGIGAAYRDRSGWVGDVRGTFRPTTSSELLRTSNGGNAPMHTWEASAAIGYEF